PTWPADTAVIEPSACVVTFPGPLSFTVMALPVLRFLSEVFSEPVVRVVVDPSAALSVLVYSLRTGKATRTLNPQKDLFRVNGPASSRSHLGPRPARAGDAVSTPANMPSSAASVTITLNRFMMIQTPASPGHHAVVSAGHYPPAPESRSM